MIDLGQVNALHKSIRRCIGGQGAIIDDIITHHSNGVRPVPVGYLVTFHNEHGCRAAYFSAADLVEEERLPQWCMMMAGKPVS